MGNIASKKTTKPLYKGFPTKYISVLLIGFMILTWEITSQLGLYHDFALPAPSRIYRAFFEAFPGILPHIGTTLAEAGIGFVLSIVFAIILAVLMDNYQLIKEAIYPILIISQTVPLIVLAPLFAIWFGFGLLPKVVIVVLICFFPIVISLYEGLESADPDMLSLLKSMGASPYQIFKLVKFPAAMTGFFSGLRISATYSIMGAVIGEWMGGSKGLGIYIIRSKNSFALHNVFVGILIVVMLSMAVFKAIDVMQYIAMPWSRTNGHE